MRSFISTAAVALAATTLVSAAPSKPASTLISIPRGNNFPNSQGSDLARIQQQAFGTLSNVKGAPLKDGKNSDSVTSLQFVAYNELFESAYFSHVLQRLEPTKANAKFRSTLHKLNVDEDVLISSLKSIVAVEELHTLNALKALAANGAPTILPCKYKFPVDDIFAAIQLAARFTDVVEGTLQDVIFHAASAGDAGLTVGVASSAEDEGEQEGGFRLWLGANRPQSQPFHTRSVREYAFSILQNFVVECPKQNDVLFNKLKTFPALTADDPSVHTKTIEFTMDFSDLLPKGGNNFRAQPQQNNKDLSITYLNGQNVITVPIKSLKFVKNSLKAVAVAEFPQAQFDMFGLVLAVVTKGGFKSNTQFATVQSVVDATVFGPAPLEVQE